jgi:hypothetical protein
MTKKTNRVGEIAKNRYGSIMKITRYGGWGDVDVTFENGCVIHTNYGSFAKGFTSNPFDRKTYNVGYFGIGKHMSVEKSYSIWADIFRRCYNPKCLVKFNTYIGCSVCEEWHNYQNFADWHDENYYIVNNERMELDKDILFKGNKIYSPKTCVYVPQKINYLFIKSNKRRGNYPIGVYLRNDGNKYIAQCDNDGKAIYLGAYDTTEEAFEVYKSYKEHLIKEIADRYKNKIPEKLYKAMYNYVVEITD